MLRNVDLGDPIAYLALANGTPVYSSDDQEVGKVTHVLADEGEDVFDGIVFHHGVHGHLFADADDIDRIYERGVMLKLDLAAAEQLPKPSANPAVIRDDPAESQSEWRHQKLRRAWDLISGKKY
jgi:PRC-barrel domain